MFLGLKLFKIFGELWFFEKNRAAVMKFELVWKWFVLTGAELFLILSLFSIY